MTIVPVSIEARTRSGGMAVKASRSGARFTPESWQDAQRRLYRAGASDMAAAFGLRATAPKGPDTTYLPQASG